MAHVHCQCHGRYATVWHTFSREQLRVSTVRTVTYCLPVAGTGAVHEYAWQDSRQEHATRAVLSNCMHAAQPQRRDMNQQLCNLERERAPAPPPDAR